MNIAAAVSEARPKPFHTERVSWVHHWTDRLFSLRIARPASFRFTSGQFVMMGLEVGNRPLLRAYSIASPAWDDELEFYSIKVDDGPLTSLLKSVTPGDTIVLGRKPTGTLVLDALRPGRVLYLISTGTGLAPFLSIIREPETYERFDKIVLTHTCRRLADQSYREFLANEFRSDCYIGELVGEKLLYYPTTTREPSANNGRITDLIRSRRLFQDLGMPELNPEFDRVMLCGGTPFLNEMKGLLSSRGFSEGSVSAQGDYVVEKAFVET